MQRTLGKTIEFLIIVEEKLPIKWKNIMKYCQVNSDSEELDNSDEEIIIKPKRKTPKYNLTLS